MKNLCFAFASQQNTMWPKLVELTARFPKKRWRRNVIFTYDGLMSTYCFKLIQQNSRNGQISVSVGATMSLFLGCSFLSFAEILYFVVAHCIENVQNY